MHCQKLQFCCCCSCSFSMAGCYLLLATSCKLVIELYSQCKLIIHLPNSMVEQEQSFFYMCYCQHFPGKFCTEKSQELWAGQSCKYLPKPISESNFQFYRGLVEMDRLSVVLLFGICLLFQMQINHLYRHVPPL